VRILGVLALVFIERVQVHTLAHRLDIERDLCLAALALVLAG
jgi:hypothetical protein